MSRPRSQSGTKRAADELTDETTGLTPFIGGMGMESPRAGKTPKLSAAAPPKPQSPRATVDSGTVPTPFQLPVNGVAGEDGMDTEDSGSGSDHDGMADMLAFHQQCHGSAEKKSAAQIKLEEAMLSPIGVDAAGGEDDGWATVKSDKKKGKKKDKDYDDVPDDAYVDHDWSSDDGCWDDSRDMAKTGAGSAGKGKHSHSFKASQARGMAIAKRDAQRGGSKR
eukprot:TRINITY_DN21218_c0_g1_i1.p1 TRINITY_DN21218_c0_g1~~TRINITY_DN21218_c0_g1_i1.p1  ORF type:complete len:222 (+),score=35.41 TRINITY_DN21218_c0_g1_i1:263-928(+)